MTTTSTLVPSSVRHRFLDVEADAGQRDAVGELEELAEAGPNASVTIDDEDADGTGVEFG